MSWKHSAQYKTRPELAPDFLPVGLRHAAAAAACALAAAGRARAKVAAGSGTAAAPVEPACPAALVSGATVTVTCGYTAAAQYWSVPAGVSQATFTLYGAEGGAGVGGAAGLGAKPTGTRPVSVGTVLQVNVGQAGGSGSGGTFGGGGTAGPASGQGGGASDIRDGSYTR